jgi:hypothetical protein
MDTFVYISGPSCSGKSTLCNYITHQYLVDNYVIGDTHWLKYPDHAFNDRVRLTNASIIETVHTVSGHLIVCEWVPSIGEFPCELQRICIARGFQFLQVALNADSSILRNRKMSRDGNCDTDLSIMRICSSQRMCLIVDTGKNDIDTMCKSTCEWLSKMRSQDVPLYNGTDE